MLSPEVRERGTVLSDLCCRFYVPGKKSIAGKSYFFSPSSSAILKESSSNGFLMKPGRADCFGT